MELKQENEENFRGLGIGFKTLKRNDPKLHDYFLQYVKNGWSPLSFAAFLKGGEKDFWFLRKNDPLFKEINDTYKKPFYKMRFGE